MKNILFLFCFSLTILSCKESLEDRAYREAKEYTQKNCPTPPQDFTILDSVSFDKKECMFKFYHRIVDVADSKDNFIGKQKEMHEALVKNLKNDIHFKVYKDAGFSFFFIFCSNKNKKEILYQDTIKEDNYR